MQVFSGYVTYHRSWNESSKVQERGNRDSDKLLCNNVVYIQGLMVEPVKIVVILNLEALQSVK